MWMRPSFQPPYLQSQVCHHMEWSDMHRRPGHGPGGRRPGVQWGVLFAGALNSYTRRVSPLQSFIQLLHSMHCIRALALQDNTWEIVKAACTLPHPDCTEVPSCGILTALKVPVAASCEAPLSVSQVKYKLQLLFSLVCPSNNIWVPASCAAALWICLVISNSTLIPEEVPGLENRGRSRNIAMEALKGAVLLYLVVRSALSPVLVVANDPSPLQDICVADLSSPVKVNGYVCKDPDAVTVNDFIYHGLHNRGDTNNGNRQKTTQVFVTQLPGLNTLGAAFARLDFDVGGINVPHTHPRATEIFLVMEGALYMGFITTANKLFVTTLYKGDVFVFPRGLVHFQINVGSGPALAFAGFNSQAPGLLQIAPSLFNSTPPIDDSVLRNGFRTDQATVDQIRSNFRTAWRVREYWCETMFIPVPKSSV